jgi:hypothetical protein
MNEFSKSQFMYLVPQKISWYAYVHKKEDKTIVVVVVVVVVVTYVDRLLLLL